MRTETAIRQFLTFLRKPRFLDKNEESLSFVTVTKLFFMVFCFEMLLFIPISSALGLEKIPHAMEDILNNQSIFLVIALAVIIAPITEEIIFRYHLRYKSFIYFFLLIIFLALLAFGLGMSMPGLIDRISAQAMLSKVSSNFFIGPLVLFLWIGLFLLLHQWDKKVPEERVIKIFPAVFYLSALIFALVHISNFELDPSRWFIAPLLVVPQFILALYLGYVRMTNGILYSIYVHALNNAIPIFLFTLASR